MLAANAEALAQPVPEPVFVLDEDVAHEVAGLLRSMGYNADSAKEMGRLGLTDVQVLVRAADEGRVVVTSNSKDFRALHEARVTRRARWANEVALALDVPIALSTHSGVSIVSHLTVQEHGQILADFADLAGSLSDRLFAWTAAQGLHEVRF